MHCYQNAEISLYAHIMLEHTSVGIAVYDAQDLRLLEANTLFLALFDTLLFPCWRHGKIRGHCLTEWEFDGEKGHPANEDIVEIFHQVVKTGVPYRSTEYSFNSKQGIRYWDWALNLVQATDGEMNYIVHTICEVTEQVLARKRAEQANSALINTNSIVEAERKRLEVIEIVARCVRDSLDAEHISNVTIDAIRTYFHANSACIHKADPAQKVLRLLCSYPSLTENETLRQLEYIPYESVVMAKQASIHHTPIVVEDMQAAGGGEPQSAKNPIALMGRGYVCVPLWFGDHFEGTLCAIFPNPICLEGPEVSALVGSSMHIAAALAQARLHATIERQHSRLRAILDQLPEGILIAEVSNGSISYANPAAAQILGISLPELVEIPLHRHQWSQQQREATPRSSSLLPWNFVVVRALCGDTIRSKETMVVRPDGSKVVTLTSSAPLYADNEIMTGAMLVFQDVTAQKSLEQHKNDFFSIANHELRTPITIIQGFAEILQLKGTQDHSLDALTKYALTSISEQSQHLTHLIEEMLDISRIEQAQFILRQTPHDMLTLLKRVIESQAVTTRQHTLRLVTEGLQAENTLIGTIDGERMVQVLNNLVSNAIKYSPAGSEIEIGIRYVQETPHEVLLWVKDHGIGIAANEIQNIFKRFHRASNIDHSTSGFGIGLYLVKEVIGRHGGRVWVESKEGEGSTFFIMLPLNTPNNL